MMKFFGLEFTREERSDLDAINDHWYKSVFEVLSPTASGQRVTPDSALRLTAVSCAVRLLSEAAASLPIYLYEQLSDDTRERKTTHPLNPLINAQPNRWQTRFEFIELMMTHMLLRGNAYAQIVANRDGQISQLIPLHPDRVEVKITERNKIQYHLKRIDGTTRVFPFSQILHVRNTSLDGVVGLSPIELTKEAMGMTMAAEEYGARFFSNDSTPGGVLVHPGKLDQKAHKRIKESWDAAQAGNRNSHAAAILEEGMEFKAISVSAKDAQFIEARQFQVEEVARVFNVPPHMLKDLRRATFSNIEDQDLAFLKYSLRPWLVRWEQALRRDVVSLVEEPSFDNVYFIEFDTSSLTEADTKTQNESFATGIQNGYLSINDVRKRLNLNPIEFGDIHLAPLNMIPLDRLPSFPFNGQDPEDETVEPDEEDEDENDAERAIRQAFVKALREPFRKLISKEQRQAKQALKKGEALDSWADVFYPKHRQLVFDTLREAGEGYLSYKSVSIGIAPCDTDYRTDQAVEYGVGLYIKRAQEESVSNTEWLDVKDYDTFIEEFLDNIKDFARLA